MGKQAKAAKSSTRIVIVDDDQFQLKLLSHQLSMVGYKQVTAFDDGRTALDYLAGQDLENTLIILDLGMPNMDGPEFLQNLHEANYPGALLLVDCEDESLLQSSQTIASKSKLRVLGHIDKPVQEEQLEEYLDLIAEQRDESLHGKKQHRYTPGELRSALDAGELVNYYQPKVNLGSGALEGVEALVRWEHPQDGIVTPNDFIDLAEECNMIDRVAQQVLSNAMADSAVWKSAGLKLSIAVNISMYNLNTRDFISYLESELRNSGLDPQDLTLEIREVELLKDYSMVLDMLTRLRLRRVNLSIDDFGKGHSSMRQLRDLPFNELKIDRGIVHSACNDVALHDVFDGSMKLAKNLGIKTVAEGVEDEADWAYLGGSGCDLAQGFFIGKPMRATELSDWNTNWAARYATIPSPLSSQH